MPDTFADKIRGMLLLGAYGDALGAEHEGQEAVAPEPFPRTLPARPMPEKGEPWGTWMPSIVFAQQVGMPTDDTGYRLCILHPWLEMIANGERTFDEASFCDFMAELQNQPLYPEWYAAPCKQQLGAWLQMFQAEKESRSEAFFHPQVPVVFGLFLYLEMAAVHHGATPVETFMFYERQARLDQGYAKAVTAFLATLVSLAVNESPDSDSFAVWFFRRSRAVLEDLDHHGSLLRQQDVPILRALLNTMEELGTTLQAETERTFNNVFKQRVLDPPHPPFMDQPFLGGLHDPYRALSHIVATIGYVNNDPAAALRTIAYSFGDTDTTASFLGTLMGAWYGASRLYAVSTSGADFSTELDVVKTCLAERFRIDLSQRIQIFSRLRQTEEAGHKE